MYFIFKYNYNYVNEIKMCQELGCNKLLIGIFDFRGGWDSWCGALGGGCALGVGFVFIGLRCPELSPTAYWRKRPNQAPSYYWGNKNFTFFYGTLEPQIQWWVSRTMETDMQDLRYPHICECGIFNLYGNLRAKITTSVVALGPIIPSVNTINGVER